MAYAYSLALLHMKAFPKMFRIRGTEELGKNLKWEHVAANLSLYTNY